MQGAPRGLHVTDVPFRHMSLPGIQTRDVSKVWQVGHVLWVPLQWGHY